jgi:ABC-type dipeptide/oligopeptide/nickel transport system permease subunit
LDIGPFFNWHCIRACDLTRRKVLPFLPPPHPSFPKHSFSLAVFGVNLLGDAMRDVLDPRLRAG